jgi:hypothetical protein
MSNFGSFNHLSMDQQRRLLYSRDRDNRGSHLSQDEQASLMGCLEAYAMPIISHEQFSQECLRAYGKEPGHAKEVFDDPRRNVKDVPACIFYAYEANKFPQELAVHTFHLDHVDKEVQRFHDQQQDFTNVIDNLKKRDTKEETAKVRDEYDVIHSKMTGKKKVVSMYKIQR